MSISARHFVYLIIIFFLFLPGGLCVPHVVRAEEGGGESAAKEEGSKKEGEVKEESGAAHPDFEYIDIRPLSIPLITDQGAMQQVTVVISLEVPYGKRDDVRALEPKLADAYLQSLYGGISSGRILKDGKTVLDPVAVHDRLNDITAKILTQDLYHDVMLQVMQQKKI